MRIEFFLALRYLLRRRKAGFVSVISLISVAGVALGVMALIVVLAVMSGFDRELKTKIVGINPHVLITQPQGIAAHEQLKKQIKLFDIPKLKSLQPYVVGQAIIRSDYNALGVHVKGLEADDQTFEDLKPYLAGGELTFQVAEKQLEDDPSAGIILGLSLARELNVRIGDTVHLISPHLEKPTLFKSSAKAEAFRVNGIFQFGLYDVDTGVSLISLNSAQDLYNMDERVTGLSLKLEDVYWAEKVKNALYDNLEMLYSIQTWIDMNRNFFAALQVEKNVMTILLFLIILVAAFNIVSTLIMVVMEKTKDIGILKAIGIRKGTIKRIFILQGMLVGLFGTAVGVVGGLMFVKWLNPIADLIEQATGFEVFPSDIYFFDKIPAEVNTIDVVLVAALAFITTVLAGLYPAKRASDLVPVEALRYE